MTRSSDPYLPWASILRYTHIYTHTHTYYVHHTQFRSLLAMGEYSAVQSMPLGVPFGFHFDQDTIELEVKFDGFDWSPAFQIGQQEAEVCVCMCVCSCVYVCMCMCGCVCLDGGSRGVCSYVCIPCVYACMCMYVCVSRCDAWMFFKTC